MKSPKSPENGLKLMGAASRIASAPASEGTLLDVIARGSAGGPSRGPRADGMENWDWQDAATSPVPRYNNPDGTGHGSVYHDDGVPAYEKWQAALSNR
jgi:hypothetical protein